MSRQPIVRVLPPGVELIWSCPIHNVRAGDRWVSDKDDVAVDSVALVEVGLDESEVVAITGRIIRGTGRGNKVRTWVFNGGQTLDIERGHP